MDKYAQLYEEYKSGKTVAQLSQEYNLHHLTIIRHWKTSGYKTGLHRHRYANSPTKEQVLEWYQEHIAGSNLEMIREKFGITRKTLIHHFKYYQLPILKQWRSWRFNDRELPGKNHNFFDEIDSELKAYLLGFAIADGHVSQDGKYFVVTSIDNYITNLFRDSIAPSLKLIKSSGKAFVFNCYSTHLVSTLSRYGIIPRKSWANHALPEVRPDLMKHLIRGIFDGDGWCTVGLTKTNDMHRTLGICGRSYSLLTDISDWCNTQDIQMSLNMRKDGLYKLLVRNLKSFKNWNIVFYSDATYYLTRKYDKVNLCGITPREFRELKNMEPRNA